MRCDGRLARRVASVWMRAISGPTAALVLAAVLVPGLASGEIYRWIDERGTVHYTDNPNTIPEPYRSQAAPLGLRSTPVAPAAPDSPGPRPSTPEPPPSVGSLPPLPPGVRVSTDYEYYEIAGASERDLRAQLKALGPERHHALTKWTISWSYPFAIEGGRCATGPITVDVKMTLVFPRWTAPASAPPTLRQKWSAALAGLQRHEDGHREIVLRAAHDVLQTLGSLPPYTSCNELKQAASAAGHRILDRSRREHDAYDELTKRGTTQGAHW